MPLIRDKQTGVVQNVEDEAEAKVLLGYEDGKRNEEVSEAQLDEKNSPENAPEEQARLKNAKKLEGKRGANDDGGADSGAPRARR